ncbi:uncharacterized protein BX664DRAFT_386781 [Halteromyces radiatus]|uniref:uncharacterized protein n=1 Tax=Halteromyces radiatus TaxID=101107 RepID=UPI002220425F|nr:uncharacterized protein BX664DRAFT_386781 [Halteromyces radiatus]KAI8086360.1 hypothetical protein BX664DRAFT_386781 [Halteromyces radiatus]
MTTLPFNMSTHNTTATVPLSRDERTDDLSSFYTSYTEQPTTSTLNELQTYELNNQTWQNMLDTWIPSSINEQKQVLNLSSISLPPTPPNQSPNSSFDLSFLTSLLPSRDLTPPRSTMPYSSSSILTSPSPPLTNTPTPSLSSLSSSSSSSISNHGASKYRRRASDHPPSRTNRPYRRRASSHPSVASVVSLTAHEPVSVTINGIEHITFLYSHDRLVKEYTIRTDVKTVDESTLPIVFKAQNTIYPRANVERSKYEGNRWDYETNCNSLGWKLCWLNQDQLCGRRGLIQRAVDSYRNRHTEMRSRRVTRQEKVANGTLRKRKSKKSIDMM